MDTDLTARDIIELLDLAHLEGEGGYFRRTWVRQPDQGEFPEATHIYYLITPDTFSAMHRLRHDEMLHFYLGDPCRSVTIAENGSITEAILGQDIRAGMQMHYLVPGGTWQGTKLLEGGQFALLGTTISPGFHSSGFELATSSFLSALEPGVAAYIREYLALQGV